MEAGSVFVRWFAPEVDLVFADDDDRRFLESLDLLPVQVPRGDEWEDLVGRLVWEHCNYGAPSASDCWARAPRSKFSMP